MIANRQPRIQQVGILNCGVFWLPPVVAKVLYQPSLVLYHTDLNPEWFWLFSGRSCR